MFSVKNIPSTSSILSTYTTFSASAMLVRSVVSEIQAIIVQLIPEHLRNLLLSRFDGFFLNPYSQMTLVINEYEGFSINELYEASETYLQTKISASMGRVKAFKVSRDNKVKMTIHKGQKVIDAYEGIELKWEMICVETKENIHIGKPGRNMGNENRLLELRFNNKCMEMVTMSYLPYVMERSKAIKEENKVVKLFSLKNFICDGHGGWGSTNLDHPATFDKLAMDPAVKKELIDDLDRFLRRRDFYRRVGKAWKRGYLLYGPPGTGKSSLIAAMANYLKFDVYDLELTGLSNSQLRGLLISTRNRSMVVIEDIDCSIEFKNRQSERFELGEYDGYEEDTNEQLTLSGLLNFIDGLWSSCGDERIIVFTTNHKDKLDPALLRPGRMDMHIHLSYCTPSGFRVLAWNYLCISDHDLFDEIDELMMQVEVTPAEVAEELMKSEDIDIALDGLLKFLQHKKSKSENCDSDGRETGLEDENERNGRNESENKIKAKERGGEIDKIIKMRKKARNIRVKHRINLLNNLNC